MQEKVVLNTTPIIYLSKINKFNLLKNLFSEVFIPEAVYNEVLFKTDIASSTLLDNLDWVHVIKVNNPNCIKFNDPTLHYGEKEVIQVATEINADKIIIDDNAAKVEAESHNFTCYGTCMIFILAKDDGIISIVKPFVDMIKSVGFRLSLDDFNRVLMAAKEPLIP